jgi:G6PDH family F420-dependent oxidoreductase
VKLGYFLSSEEHGPRELVRHARMAQDQGFEALWISDHYHPWNDEQGQSPFVWGTIGALSETVSVPITTAVTCPTLRVHPAVIAQAAATAAVQCEGRFVLGVGSGEALNEHVLGSHWPSADVRLEMLEEAIGIIRTLHQGDELTHHGKHYTVENARVYTLPERPVPIYVSAFGPQGGPARGPLRRRVHGRRTGR